VTFAEFHIALTQTTSSKRLLFPQIKTFFLCLIEHNDDIVSETSRREGYNIPKRLPEFLKKRTQASLEIQFFAVR